MALESVRPWALAFKNRYSRLLELARTSSSYCRRKEPSALVVVVISSAPRKPSLRLYFAPLILQPLSLSCPHHTWYKYRHYTTFRTHPAKVASSSVSNSLETASRATQTNTHKHKEEGKLFFTDCFLLLTITGES